MNPSPSFYLKYIELASGTYHYYPIQQMEGISDNKLDQLPYCIRILLEGSLRSVANGSGSLDDLVKIARWAPISIEPRPTIGYTPGRVVLQDLTGVPVLVDLASLRSARKRIGEDPKKINPVIPVDLVVDHSLQIDFFGSADSKQKNQEMEYLRNKERYSFLKWAQKEFSNLRIIPPGGGIVHQVNLEYLAQVIQVRSVDAKKWVQAETLVGTDSHTSMINGLGILGWGVGGIEAIAAMLGQPVEMLLPDVVGVELTGQLHSGTSPTDIVLTLTHLLRKVGVVNKIVEFFGPSSSALSVPDRAMMANMAPEYGATAAYFPVDDRTLEYLYDTGRKPEMVELVKAYYRAQDLFRDGNSPDPEYSQTIRLNLSEIEPSLAGPKRPQDLVRLSTVAENFKTSLLTPVGQMGYGVSDLDNSQPVMINLQNRSYALEHGSVVIAAITSCTNTSNPTAMISAGLLAKKAVELGLTTSPAIKTSFTPGSPVVVDYLQKAGLLHYLEALGFYVNGFGCATCIGNSGPLAPQVVEAIEEHHLITAAVLSGNRNFEGRIHPNVQANYLASPALVVAFAIAGSIRVDLENQPIGISGTGKEVFFEDIWPSENEVSSLVIKSINPGSYVGKRKQLFEGDQFWKGLDAPDGALYPWELSSSYLKETPFCGAVERFPDEIQRARALAIFGDSITTDHISPAGAISIHTPAADYLLDLGISPREFNTYGSRRGNHEVMARSTFANIRLKNKMLSGKEGGFTIHYPETRQMSIFDAAEQYRLEGIPLIIIAGKEYGTGSSRDWAAKGLRLLGVRAVIAESFERIHRSNLVGMGILPLVFEDGMNAESLGLTGAEEFTLVGLNQLATKSSIQVTASTGMTVQTFRATALIQSDYERESLQKGGVFQMFNQ